MASTRLVFMFTAQLLCVASVHHVDLAIISYKFPGSMGCLPYVSPAIQTATAEVNTNSTVFGDTFQVTSTTFYKEDDTNCALFEEDYEQILAEWYYRRRRPNTVISIPVVTGCVWNDVLDRYSLAWNQLILVTTTFGHKKLERPALTNVIQNTFLVGTSYFQFLTAILDHFNWSTIFVLHDAASVVMYRGSSDFVRSTAAGAGKTVYFKQVDSAKEPPAYEEIFREYANVSRVFCYFGNGYKLRPLMLQAAVRNFTNGEHVFIALEPAPGAPTFYGALNWYVAGDSNATNEMALRAYRSVLIFGISEREAPVHSKYLQVTEEIRRLALRDYNFTYPADGRRNLVVCAYTLVFMLLQVLSESMSANLSTFFGDDLTKLFRNRTFATPLGSVYINGQGERGLNMSLDVFDVTGRRVTFAEQESSSGHITFFDHILDWPGQQWPPPNRPLCGYDGQLCLQSDVLGAATRNIATGAGIALALLLVAAICWLVRRGPREERVWQLQHKYLRTMSVVASEPYMAFGNSDNRSGTRVQLSPFHPASKLV